VRLHALKDARQQLGEASLRCFPLYSNSFQLQKIRAGKARGQTRHRVLAYASSVKTAPAGQRQWMPARSRHDVDLVRYDAAGLRQKT
jgi:hypothetical protein